MPVRRITLITIDLDDTLWPCAPVIEQAEQTLFHWLRDSATRLTAVHDIESLRRHRLELARHHPHLAHDLSALRHHSLAHLLAQHGYDRALARHAMAVFLEARNRVTPYPEVAHALERLSTHYTLVALSNGNADVAATPLGRYFTDAINAAEAGAAKPDPAMFRLALQRTATPPQQALHVGDHPRQDVRGAAAAGMLSAWLNRHGAPWPAQEPAPDLHLSDLAELAQHLARHLGAGD